MNADLVVVRCGRASRHPSWLRGTESRSFDLALCPYEESAPEGDGASPAAAPIPGPKWTGLAEFLAHDSTWRSYEYVWLPDDDLSTDAADVARFFDLCRRHGAALAAPALHEESCWSHVVTLRNRSFVARETTFVEIMAPCFRRDVLERLLPTFSASRTGHGWGLDDAWGRLLGYRGLHVFDEVTVLHDRPVGHGRTRAERRAARREMRRLRREFDAVSVRKTRAGIGRDGVRLDEGDPRFLDAYLEGYRWLTERTEGARERILGEQREDPDAWLRAAGDRGAAPVDV
jgi:hypothetical protein